MGRTDIGLKCVQVRSLIEKRAYEEALEVVESIDIDRVASIVDLKVLASVYERLGMYEEAKQVLLRSYEKKPTKMAVYRLAYLCLKNKEFDDAEFFYQEFCAMAPKSPDRYILRYGIDREKGVDYYLRIATLQKLKKVNYSEEWGYELAKIYHKAGLYEDCVRECRDLMIWFGDGVIVEKARMLYRYHVEGKESLDAYGVFDEDLSPEEVEYRREQYLVDTSDYHEQVQEVLEQEQQYKIRQQLNRDLEKTVDLSQMMIAEGEDQDLLKQEVQRAWGEPVTNEHKEALQLEKLRLAAEQHTLGIKTVNPGDMTEIIPEEPVQIEDDMEETQEMLATSIAEVMEEDDAYEKPKCHSRRNARRAEKRARRKKAEEEAVWKAQLESDLVEPVVEEVIALASEELMWTEPMEAELEEAALEEQSEAEIEEAEWEEQSEAEIEEAAWEEQSEAELEEAEWEEQSEAELEEAMLEEQSEAEIEETALEEQTEAELEEAMLEEQTEAETEEDVQEQQEEEGNDFVQEYGVLLWEYFSEYQNNIPLCEAVYEALEKAKNGQRPLNFLITCKDRERAAQMGRDLAKAMCALGITEKQQVARITAEKLNGMHLEQNYDRLAGGSLLVENAKHMTADTCQSIMNMIEEMQDQIVVMLTDARPYMCDLMDEYSVMKRYFPYDLNMK